MIISAFNTDPVLQSISGRHHAWHTSGGAHGFPERSFPQGSPGSGTEFLTFHRNLMNEFFTWNNVHHAASGTQIAAWTSIPPFLKTAPLGWNATLQSAETRINSSSPPFANADALGIHIETTIHNWIHGAVGKSSLPMDPGESDIISHTHSVQSTYFYQIHGLVQFWWDHWLLRRGIPTKRIIDSISVKVSIKETVKETTKEHSKELTKEVILEAKHNIKEFKEKDKDLFENPSFPFRPDFDPSISLLHDRITSLENVIKGSSFIKKEERPEVGGGH